MTHLPHINLNGDTPNVLYQQNEAIRLAAFALKQAMIKARPHGRNWQTAPGGTSASAGHGYDDARSTHEAHLAMVEVIYQDALNVMIHCADAPRYSEEEVNRLRETNPLLTS